MKSLTSSVRWLLAFAFVNVARTNLLSVPLIEGGGKLDTTLV